MNCKLYCLFISTFSVFFLFYLFLLVALGSETLYIEVHNRLASAFALFVSAALYAGLAGYLYYDQFMTVDRKQQLKQWIEEQKGERKDQHEMRERARQSKVVEQASKAKLVEE